MFNTSIYYLILMSDYMMVKIWHGGTVIQEPKVKYDGGDSKIFQIDVDKMSYFEIIGYVMDCGSYESTNLLMYYLNPGTKLENGLVELKDDKDVSVLLNKFRKKLNTKICNIYTTRSQIFSPPAQPSKLVAQPSNLLTQPSNPATHMTSNKIPSIFQDTDDDESQSDEVVEVEEHGTVIGSESESDDIVEVEEEEQIDEVIGSESDTDDEEWKTARFSIVKVNKEQQLLKKNIVEDFLKETRQEVEETHNTVVDETYSSYEDSEGDVNSPGESEEDDIRGKKYKPDIPVVTDLTDWSKWVWVVGTRFPTREAFRDAVRKYAVTQGRNLKIASSNKKRNGRVIVCCIEGCPFKLYLSFYERKGCFMVKSVRPKHTCQRNMSKNRQLTADFIASEFLPIFKARPHWPAKEIMEAVKERYKVLINRWMAYKAKSCAHKKLHGSMRDHYSKMGSYLRALRDNNPTSTFTLVTDPHEEDASLEVFSRVFVCFDGVKKGFLAGCRTFLCLDGCFLKTFLGGMLLAAVGRDGNDQMFPVAWAVVKGENTDSWTWFLFELRRCLGVTDGGRGWTLISDQQKGLLNGVALNWENAEHRNCARHIYANWHKKFKGDDLKGLFWRAARAYCEKDYKKTLDEMKEVSMDAADAFLKQNPRCFCRCFLDPNSKCDVIVNNMAETFNGYILQSRSKHIIFMLEDIRLSIMTRLNTKEDEMADEKVIVCPRIQVKLNREKDNAFRCDVYPSSKTLFQVKSYDDVVVNLRERTCSCRKWDLSGIPCFHVCAVAGFLKRDAEEFVHSYYTKEMYMKSYAYSILAMAGEDYWPVVEMPMDPPPIKIQPGRPKKNRRKDPHEDPKKPGKLSRHGVLISCSVCKQKGHNKRGCKQKGTATTVEPSQPKRNRGRPRKTAPHATTVGSQQSRAVAGSSQQSRAVAGSSQQSRAVAVGSQHSRALAVGSHGFRSLAVGSQHSLAAAFGSQQSREATQGSQQSRAASQPSKQSTQPKRKKGKP
ncbi:hypothetical protein QVD17_09590 [Tagetes erecta]|uniref:SWIM-type domain-containing protein n=1 Tax=Tagetes erecta TaxID=13708 RepID=A0AAD8P5F5_TARER|nr:hypothetical protein QVD17_09590 [Tagetes erecta]